MAKIDTSKIEGFDTMTDAEKIAALTGYDIPDPDYTGYIPKSKFDATASELAQMKREKKDAMSESERLKTEQDEKIAKLTADLAEMTARETKSKYTAKYTALGYDAKLAEETADALIKGDMDKVFANHQTFIASHDKAYKATLMTSGSTPPAGSVPDGRADYSKLITEAQERGDVSAVAYYTRLEQMSNK